jgi:ribosomal protein L37AE/L43A
MTDILTKLAALTAKDEASPVPACPFCGSLDGSKRHDDGRFWWHCDACGATGPALSRYSEDDNPRWESRPREQALIALVRDAASEIERLRATIAGILPMHGSMPKEARERWLPEVKEARQLINPQEPTS